MFELARREGIEKGQLEDRKRLARDMLQKGMDINLIAELIKFSVEEIEKLWK